MKVYLNSITGIDDAIVSMFMSKRSWTREKEENIRNLCDRLFNRNGKFKKEINQNDLDEFNTLTNSLVKFGWRHITMLRYIDFSITVEGLHRGGQDDWDSHAKRFNNRIIRSSTRLSDFGNEKSDYYKDKILTTDEALDILEIKAPNEIIKNGIKYVKTINGYIREDMKDNKDVKRGLYMLSIPSNFIFKIDLCEYGHVFKERNIKGTANPEVKECCESIADQIEEWIPQFNRELFEKIKN